eukprot:gnl/MRDRNA2_/MRDRNA2_82232_c0_seq1.p1 gnl/MRDRNA2_/MRDRNA2_82232_c0~~gnl/MRDRNA2_/MRDRNA2_82232_c0_seq1.p1  ORF type:complete len:355 (+),score=72.76 gnl/MRDRNA2_/MRDRNA2_82232_c0_seq1:52-1116(+)
MNNAIVVTCLTFIAQGKTQQHQNDDTVDTHTFSNLLKRGLQGQFFHQTDLENTTLDKGLHANFAQCRTLPACALHIPVPSLRQTKPSMRNEWTAFGHISRRHPGSVLVKADQSPWGGASFGENIRQKREEADQEEEIDSIPLAGGYRIQRATTKQLTPLYADQVMDKVADMVTESIFEPELSEKLVKAKDLRPFVYKKLTDRYGPYAIKASANNALFLAYDDKNKLVGCIGVAVVDIRETGMDMGLERGDRPLLEFLSVLPSERGKKIGKSLVDRVELQAEDWGYDEMLLQVASINDAAIKLYEKMGYKTLGEDKSIKRPGKGDAFGGLFGGLSVNWIPALHKVMRKELEGGIL